MDDAGSPPAPAAPPPPAGPRRRPRSGARLLVGISIMGLVTLGAAAAGLFFFAESGFPVASGGDPSFLEVRVNQELTDAPGDVGLALDPKDFPALLTEVAADVRAAAVDTKIQGLNMELSDVTVGWAGAQELHDAVAVFSASGKPCYAYAETFDNKSYFVASACTQVFIAPAGLSLVNGFSLTTEYYAGTFEKLGVRAQFEHVGDFKSAVEPLQRTGPSEAASLAADALLDSLFEQFVAGIAAGRGMEPEVVRQLIDDPPITPEAALAAGMVDGLKYRDEVRVGMAGEERVDVRRYGAGGASPFASNRRIAVVHAEGSIVSGESGSPVFGGSFVGDRSMAEMLENVREDEDVVAVVLRVNSPGGSGLASDVIWHEVARTREAGKPVVVSMGDYAASGGYYISAGADRIVAEPGTLTGSIGVFGGKLNIAGLYDKLGITMHTYQRGQLANMLSGTSDFSELERAKFRQFLEGFYQVFLQRVADGRHMPVEQVHEVAQGRVWTGAQAMERGLVDELGGLDVAIARARELAKVEADEDLDLMRLPSRKTFVDQVLEDLQKSSLPPEALLPELRETWSALFVVSRVLDGGGIAALLPGVIRVE